MPPTIEIVTPERKVYSGEADSVTLPTLAGQISILNGHVPLTTVVVPGEIIVNRQGTVEHLAVDKGFARILDNKISILTEAAVEIEKLDYGMIEAAEKRAAEALNAAKENADADPEEVEKLEQLLRFVAVQKLIKRPR